MNSKIITMSPCRLFAYFLCHFPTHLACLHFYDGPLMRIMKRHSRAAGPRAVSANLRVGQLNFFHRHLLQAATPHASPAQELNRAIGSDGMVYVGSYDNKLYAIKTESLGLAKSRGPCAARMPDIQGGFLRSNSFVEAVLTE